MRSRLGRQVGNEIIDDARLAGGEDIEQAAAGHGPGVAGLYLDARQVRCRPVRGQLLPVIGQEGAGDAVVGNDSFEEPENLGQQVVQQHALIGILHQIEQPEQAAFALRQRLGQQAQLTPEWQQRAGRLGIRQNHPVVQAQLTQPAGVGFHLPGKNLIRDAVPAEGGAECDGHGPGLLEWAGDNLRGKP